MDKKMMDWFDGVQAYYSATYNKTWKLHKVAVQNNCISLACATKVCADALHEVKVILEDTQNAIMEASGAVRIPVKDGNKPQLKLVVNKK